MDYQDDWMGFIYFHKNVIDFHSQINILFLGIIDNDYHY